MAVTCFILYLLFFCWVITKIPFFKRAGFSAPCLVGLFLLKILAGLAYGWFYSRIPIIQSDTWNLFNFSTKETDWLLRDPLGFTKDLFTYHYHKAGNLFSGENSYWNDLKTATVIKLLAVFNVFTAKNYYADLIFFNFLFFFGPIAFFRTISYYYPQKKWLLLCSVFLLPSFLFWCSGVHKDGLIFSAMALIIYCFHLQLLQKKVLIKYLLIMLACMVLLFSLRNFILFFLIVGFLPWFIASRFPSKKWLAFIAFYAACIIIFFASPRIMPSFNLPQYVINKQAEFKLVPGSSVIPVPPLAPTVASFIHFLPSALDIAFFRPHLSEAKNISYLTAALENIGLLVLVIGCFFFRDKKIRLQPVSLFCLFFSLNILFLSAYTVTFSGSIVRYKSIMLPLLITFFIILVDEKKLPGLLPLRRKPST